MGIVFTIHIIITTPGLIPHLQGQGPDPRDLIRQDLLMHYLLSVPCFEPDGTRPQTIVDARTHGAEAGTKAFHAKMEQLAEHANQVLALVMLNVLVARHGARWDFTETRRFTLSEASRSTLRSLPDNVHLYVLLGAADPLQATE